MAKISHSHTPTPMSQPIQDSSLFATRQSLLLRLKDLDDQDGWREFFDIYWRLIYSFCLKARLSEQAAEEVVQETMISVAKQMPGFRYDRSKGSFRSWLLTVVSRRVNDRHRQEARWSRVIEPQPEPVSGEPPEIEEYPDPRRPDLDVLWASEWEGHLIRQALERVRTQVSEKQYLIYEMHVLREVPIAAVVENLQTSVAAVYVAKHRVGRLLRAQLAHLRSDDPPE